MHGFLIVAEAVGAPLVAMGCVAGVGQLAWWLLGDFLLDRVGRRNADR